MVLVSSKIPGSAFRLSDIVLTLMTPSYSGSGTGIGRMIYIICRYQSLYSTLEGMIICLYS